jgi:hypothetical protein
MVRKPFITFNDSWPWLLVSTASVGVLAKAIEYGLKNGLDVKGVVIASIVVVALLGITITRFVMRYLSIKKWNSAFQTRLGTAVISKAGEIPYRDIDQAQDDVAFFWINWAIDQGSYGYKIRSSVADAFSGATIVVYPKVIERGTEGWYGKFVGLQEGKNISVVYDKDKIKDEQALLSLVKHELSHLCLTAIGVDPGDYGDKHHKIFAEQKVGY